MPRVGPSPGTHLVSEVPGVCLTPGLTHLEACPGYQLTMSPGCVPGGSRPPPSSDFRDPHMRVR